MADSKFQTNFTHDDFHGEKTVKGAPDSKFGDLPDAPETTDSDDTAKADKAAARKAAAAAKKANAEAAEKVEEQAEITRESLDLDENGEREDDDSAS